MINTLEVPFSEGQLVLPHRRSDLALYTEQWNADDADSVETQIFADFFKNP